MVIKRCFDIVASLFGLILFSPVMLTAAFMIRLSMGSPVYFRQQRPGYKGIPVQLVKFRTMKPVCLDGFNDQSDEVRLTKMGRFLRRTSLDELPEFWNVLKGEMSIVGPRPEVPKYVALYTPEQRVVLQVRPGLSSLASMEYINENEVLGRSNDPEGTYVHEVMPAKLHLDLKYVREQSLALDLRIIFGTLTKLFG